MDKRILIILLFSFILINCSKDEEPLPDDNDIVVPPVLTPDFTVLKVINGSRVLQIINTSDGGYCGIVDYQDYSIVKYDSGFNVVWNKQYGGSENDYAESIIQTNDGGYMVSGYTKSNDGDITFNHGDNDIWLCKIDASGELSWEKSYGGSMSDGLTRPKSLMQTYDGGYIFIGYTKSEDGDISSNHGGNDAWVVKIDANGNMEFEKTFGGSSDDYGRKVIAMADKYTMLMKIGSSSGDFNASGNWVVQTDANGDMIWSTNCFGMNSGSITNTGNQEILALNVSATEYLVHKLDATGEIISNTTVDLHGVSGKQPHAYDIFTTNDNGSTIIGSMGAGNDQDAVLFRLSSEFDLLYSHVYGGNDYDKSRSLIPYNNDEFIYHINTNSINLLDINNTGVITTAFVKLTETLE